MKIHILVREGEFLARIKIGKNETVVNRYGLKQLINARDHIGSDTSLEKLYLSILNRLECGHEHCT